MCRSKSRLLVTMWGKSFLILHVAILWQGLARGASSVRVEGENDLSVSIGTKGGANIILDPDKDSALATLEHLQNENDLLRQDLEQSQAHIMALVKGLQEKNSQLKQQQENNMAMALEMIMGMGKEISGHLQTMKQQVQTQVSGVITSVGEVRSQQEMVMNMVMEMTGYVDQAHNVTSQLTRIQGRLTSVEADVLKLQVQDNDYAQQLIAVQQRMNDLESLLQGGQVTGTPPAKPSATPFTTPFVGLTSTNDHSKTGGITSREPSTPFPTTVTTASPTLFTIPPNYDVDTLVTSILVTKTGELLLGDFHANKLIMSRIVTPNDVVDTYNVRRPHSVLELEDGTIVVTLGRQMPVLRITSNGLELIKYINTEKSYYAITQGPDNTLIVSDMGEDSSSTSIDIIDMDGVVQRTLLHNVDFLRHPSCLRRFGDDVYVSDWTSGHVFRVNVYTGEVKFTIGGLDLSTLGLFQPRKFDIDGQGNLYIGTGGAVCHQRSFCIIRVTQTGSWQEMDEFGPRKAGNYPYGLELTSSQIIIAWNNWDGDWYSEVSSYSLPQVQEESTPGEAVTTTTTTTTTTSHKTGAVTNVALHKPALQSTYHPRYGHPEYAVDGNMATNIAQCTHTADSDSNPNRWWRVDLMGLYEVESVRITNRGDCCGDRLSPFDIYIADTLVDPSETHHDPNDLCLHHDQYIRDGATVRLPCDRPVVGQYVSLVLRTDAWPLHFCEIAVLGRPASGRTTESSPSSPSSQSTTSASASREEELSGSGSGDAESAEYSGYVSDDNWFVL